MFLNLNIPSFDEFLREFLREFVIRFKSRNMNSDNLLVNGIVRSAIPYVFSKIWAWWRNKLNS